MSEPITDLETAVRELGALPMPVGPEPQVDDHAKAPWGRGEDGRPLLPMGAHWTDVPELVDRHIAGIQARVDEAQPGNWFVSPTAEAPDTVCTQYDGYTRTIGRLTNVLPGDRELVLHAHSDLRWCLDMIAKLRDEVAALREERHSTNEALDDAVQELRARHDDKPTENTLAEWLYDQFVPVAGAMAWHHLSGGDRAYWELKARAVRRAVEQGGPKTSSVSESADKLTRLLAPAAEGEHYPLVHHDYRTPRDLPPLDGTR